MSIKFMDKKLQFTKIIFFWIILYQGMLPRLPKGSSGKSREVWVWLGMPGHTQPKEVVLHPAFPWSISPCKKSKKLILYFQGYWWSKNTAIWSARPFWFIICEPEFSQIWGWHKKTKNCKIFYLTLLLAKGKDKILKSILGTLYLF